MSIKKNRKEKNMSNKTLVSFSDSNKLLYKRLYSFSKRRPMSISGNFVPAVDETKGDFFIRNTFDAMFGSSKISTDIKKILIMPDDVDNDVLLAAVKTFVIDVMDKIDSSHLRYGNFAYVTHLLFNVFESISPDLINDMGVDTFYSIGRGMIPNHLDEIIDKSGLFESCFHLASGIIEVLADEADTADPEAFWDAAALMVLHCAKNPDGLDKSFRGTPDKTLEALWSELNNAQEQLRQYIIERSSADEK